MAKLESNIGRIALDLHVKVRGLRWLRFRMFVGSIMLRLATFILGPRVTVSVAFDPRVKVRAIDSTHYEARV